MFLEPFGARKGDIRRIVMILIEGQEVIVVQRGDGERVSAGDGVVLCVGQKHRLQIEYLVYGWL